MVVVTVGDQATVYLIAEGRGYEHAASVLGDGFAGVGMSVSFVHAHTLPVTIPSQQRQRAFTSIRCA